MNYFQNMSVLVVALATISAAHGQYAQITVQADKVVGHVSPNMGTGVCLEDVNHEVYGGLYSQMIFGESFQEPSQALHGFHNFGAALDVKDSIVSCPADPKANAKLIWDGTALTKGKVGVEVMRPSTNGGVVGLILNVAQAADGVDDFVGYEISLDGNQLVIGRHRHNWEPITTYPCVTAPDQWVPIEVQIDENGFTITVNGQVVGTYLDTDHPLPPGKIGLRSALGGGSFRNFWYSVDDKKNPLDFISQDPVCGTWSALRQGSAKGSYQLVKDSCFVGGQSQGITLASGNGEFGLTNAGLNGWGMNFQAGKPYNGCLWAKSDKPIDLFVALQSSDGSKVYGEQKLKLDKGDWHKLDFVLTPDTTDLQGKFAITLKSPGAITLGYSFLQPGDWGLYHELPVRADVVQGLIDQGVRVIRYGGSMVNAPDYHWKSMIGPREHRPPYKGHWYSFSSNGWGIFDFLNLCEQAGFVGIPDVSSFETPQDMADFIDYVNGPSSSPWGGKRAADGHEKPYNLKYLEFGNEETIDDAYAQRFQAVAKSVWAADPNIILIVGDFSYNAPIQDPTNIQGAQSGLTSMAAHKTILDFAKQNNREVWFDVHVWSDGPGASRSLNALPTYASALGTLADGAQYKVVVFELNANNHSQARALGNAVAVNAISRMADQLPIVTSANCLEPDGQNDNGWSQGLLFLNPSQAWLQPPGYVTQMQAKNFQPLLVASQVASSDALDVTARRSEDGKTLVLEVVNPTDQVVASTIGLTGFTISQSTSKAVELAGPLDAVNTADDQKHQVPSETDWENKFANGGTNYSFKPTSVTFLIFQ